MVEKWSIIGFEDDIAKTQKDLGTDIIVMTWMS
jgi:hypothetical protein